MVQSRLPILRKGGVFSQGGLLSTPLFDQLPGLLETLEQEMQEIPWNPSGLTLAEDDSHVYVEAKMPGLQASDIEVNLDNGVLSISGERNKEEEEKDKKKRFHRRSSYSYSYQVQVPRTVDEDRVEASYKNGVMCINFPKRTESKGKAIPVKGE